MNNKIIRNMEDVNIIVAVDFGTTQIRMIAAEKTENEKLKILGVETTQTAQGAIEFGIIEQTTVIATRLNEMIRKMENRLGNKTKINKLYVSVNGFSIHSIRKTITRNYNMPTTISQHEIASMRREACSSIIDPYELMYIEQEEFNLGNGEYIITPNDTKTIFAEANMMLVVGDKQIKTNINKILETIKMPAADYSINIISTAAAVCSQQDKINGCAVIDFGATTTSLAIYKDGILRRLCVIPFGGNHITQDILSIGCSKEQAETIKTQGFDAYPSDELMTSNIKIGNKPGFEGATYSYAQIHNIAIARLNEITGFIKSEIEKSGYSSALQNGIIITGASSHIKNLPQYLSERTKQNVRLGYHVSCIESSKDGISDNPSFSAIIGLCMTATTGCTEQKQDENVQTEKKPSKKKRGLLDRFSNLFSDDDNNLQ